MRFEVLDDLVGLQELKFCLQALFIEARVLLVLPHHYALSDLVKQPILVLGQIPQALTLALKVVLTL